MSTSAIIMYPGISIIKKASCQLEFFFFGRGTHKFDNLQPCFCETAKILALSRVTDMSHKISLLRFMRPLIAAAITRRFVVLAFNL